MMPFGVIVSSVSADSEELKVSYYTNRDRQVDVAHPFVSTSSWIRAMPEQGTSLVAMFRADDAAPQIIASGQRRSRVKTDQYKKGQGTYRPLSPGEIDIASSGGAHHYLARRPHYESRAGLIYRGASQDQLLALDRSPSHARYLMQHEADLLGDEERLGIVYRKKSAHEVFYPKVRGDFAAEKYTHVYNPALESPEVLFSEHAGHVLDEKGNPELQLVTGVPLRKANRYFANDDTVTTEEIDEKGNVYVKTAEAATDGYQLDVTTGNFIKNVALDEKYVISGNREDLVKKSVVHKVEENYTKSVTKTLRMSAALVDQAYLLEQVFDSTVDGQKYFVKACGHLFAMDGTKGSEALYLFHKGTRGTSGLTSTEDSTSLISWSGHGVFLDNTDKNLKLISANGSLINLGKSLSIADSTGANFITVTHDDGKIQLIAKKEVNITSPAVNINGGSVNIGNNAVFSATIAENLALLFDSHTHATAVGPSSPPIPPQTAALVNLNPATAFKHSYVKLRGNLG